MNIRCNHCYRHTPHSEMSCQYCHRPIDIPRPQTMDNSDYGYISWLKSKDYQVKYFMYYKNKAVDELKEIFKNYSKKQIIAIFRD